MVKRLGSNIYTGTRRKGDQLFNALIGRITWVGTPALPATNTATGTRDSVMVGGSGRGVNEVDSLTIGGIPMLGCLASDADAPTDLGVGYGVDLVSCTMPSLTEGTIIQALMPYGWSGADNPVASSGRGWETTNGYKTFPQEAASGNISLWGSSGVPRLVSNTDLSASVLEVTSSDWNPTTIGLRVGVESRITDSDTGAPSGTLCIGNTSSGARPFHGALVTGIVPWVLSDAEYEVLRVGLQNLFGGVVFQ